MAQNQSDGTRSVAVQKLCKKQFHLRYIKGQDTFTGAFCRKQGIQLSEIRWMKSLKIRGLLKLLLFHVIVIRCSLSSFEIVVGFLQRYLEMS